ncbi:MAG: beta-lactamase family protein [Verrucomicrobia bacterium]|nr:beta-lactamase family protein [Verrucomicrobiota bacterium]
MIFLLLIGSLCFGNPDRKIDAYLKAKQFQGAVLVAKGGKVLFSKGYGLANAEHRIPNCPQTVFRLGSITKQFTAVAILQLQEQGKLDVQDPITKYLPDYPNGDKITIHHLLTHTAGIPDITDFPNLAEIQRQPSTPAQVMAHFQDLPLEFEPGEKFKYSNSGYIVLGAIVEVVSGLGYERYLQENFFRPLNMHSTYLDRNQKIIPNRAAGYHLNAGGEIVNAEFIEMSFPHGAGAIASTVEDLYHWDRALKEGKLLSKQSTEQLFKVQAGTYSYGLFIDQVTHAIGHKGSIEGFRASAYRYVDQDLTVILLSNREDVNIAALQQELSSYWRP